MDRLKCGTIITFPYGMFQESKYRIIREFGDGEQIIAELECFDCPDKRGIGTKKIIPLRRLRPTG